MLSWGGENLCRANYRWQSTVEGYFNSDQKNSPGYEFSAICTILGLKPCITRARTIRTPVVCVYTHQLHIYDTWYMMQIYTHLVSEISITTWSLMYTSTLETRYPPPKIILSDFSNMFKKFLNIHFFYLHYFIINNNNTIHKNIHFVSIQIIFIGKASIQIIHTTLMENISLCSYV